MKDKLKFCILISILCLLSVFDYADSCKLTNMKKTSILSQELNGFGTADAKGPFIGGGDEEGALWIKRKILVHPRFELNLRVAISSAGCNDARSYAMDGWTIILSKTPNYISFGGAGGYIGYNNIFNAIVTEFDFHQNTEFGDISSNSISLHRCFNSNCSANENSSTIQRNITPNYDKCREMFYDIWLSYNNGRLRVDIGNLNYIDVIESLDDRFDSWIYLGFTAFYRGTTRKLDINGSFFCETDMDLNNFFYSWSSNGVITQLSRPTIPAGSNVTLRFAFRDSSNLYIPHFYLDRVWSYSISFTSSCGLLDSTVFTVVDKLNLQASFSGCSTTGDYIVSVITNKGNMSLHFSVASVGFSFLNFSGYNTILSTTETAVCRVDSSNRMFFKFGTLGGDFSIDDFGGSVSLIFRTVDYWGNLVLLGTDTTAVQSTLGISIRNNGNIVNYTTSLISNGIYRINFSLSAIGLYEFNSTRWMNGPRRYFMNVLAGRPSAVSTSCSLVNYNSSPTLDVGINVQLRCLLRDSRFNALDPNWVRQTYGISFSCNISRTNALNRVTNIIGTLTTGSDLVCSLTPDMHGTYNFSVSVGSLFTAPNQIGRFNITPSRVSLSRASVYNSFSRSFIPLSNNQNTLTYVAGTNMLTAIDFADLDNTFFSDIGYIADFNLTAFSGVIFDTHIMSYSRNVRFEFTTISTKRYVGVFLDDAATYMKISSFQYKMTINQGQLSKIDVFFSIPVPSNPFKKLVCTHNLEKRNTQFIPSVNTESIYTVNTSVILGNIIFHTTDRNLFNYKLADIKLLKSTITPNDFGTRVTFQEHPSVDGVYIINIIATKADSYILTFIYDDWLVSENYSVTFIPIYIASSFSPSNKHNYDSTLAINNVYTILNSFTSDFPQEIFFNAFDDVDNQIVAIPSLENKFFEIRVTLTINGISQSVNYDSSTVLINYNSNEKSLSIIDFYKMIGTHVLTISSSRSSKAIIITYKVNPGKVSAQESIGNLTSPKILKISQTADLSIAMKDSLGFNIASQTSALEEYKNLVVSAIAEDDSAILFNYVDVNQLLFRFSTEKLMKAGNFKVSIFYLNPVTLLLDSVPCKDCLFTVVYDTFDIKKCKLSSVLSRTIQMSTNSILQVNNQVDKPLFNFEFFDSNGIQLEYVDQKSNINAVFKGPNLEINLYKEWISTNRIIWTFPSGVDIKDIIGGNYELNILYNNIIAQKYPIQFLGDELDSDAGNGDPNYDLTFFSVTELRSFAGTKISFSIQFRTNQNLRVNKLGDLAKFIFTNNKSLKSSEFTVTVQYGAKKGEYIINVNSLVASSNNSPIIISIFYSGIQLKQDINIYVKHGELSRIILDSSLILSDTNKQLIDGKTIDIYNLVLVAYDRFGNIFEDIFDSNIFSVERISRLFNLQHENNGQVTVTASTEVSKNIIRLGVISRQAGKVSFSSFFLSQSWYWNVLSGPVSEKFTFGSIVNVGATMIAGDNALFKIFPRDDYNNIIPLSQITSNDYDALNIQISQPSGKTLTSAIEKSKNTSDESILYTIILNESGNNLLKPVLKSELFLACNVCQLKVNFGEIVFDNSILKNGLESWNRNIQNNLNKGSFPTFVLFLNDRYNNLYDYVPSNFILTVNFEGNQSNILFCSENINGSINIFVCKDNTNRKNWMYLISTSGYTLKIKYNDLSLNYPVNLVGSDDDNDASNGPIDVSKTDFSASEITVVAGETSTFLIELRTQDSKRKNYWYDNPNDNIKISFSQRESVYTSDVSMGEKPGQYYIKVSSQNVFLPPNSNNLISVTIEGILCSTTRVKMFVTPALASSSFIVDTNNIIIPYGKLQSGNADDDYVLKLVFYDKYDNLANVNVLDLNLTINPPVSRKDVKIQSKIVKNPDNSITVTINSIFSGTYTLNCNYFTNPYTFEVVSGQFSVLNSLAKAPTTATAGETIKLFIIPFDANNNYIDPSSRENAFKLAYKYKEFNSENYVAYQSISAFKIEKYTNTDIPSCSSCNAYTYTVQVKYRNQNYFKFTLGDSAEIKCINCVTEVFPSSLVFTKSLFMRLDSGSGKFVELTDSANEDNSKADIIYRIYPRDFYLNRIDTITSSSSNTLDLTDKDGKKYKLLNVISDSSTQQYIEFIKNDVKSVNGDLTYNTLTGGNYSANFSNGSENIIKNIVLIGRPDDNVASNQEIEEQNTVINEMNLNFIAGQSGYLIIELRTVNNLRKNNWNQDVKLSYKIVDENNNKLNIEDKSFTSNVRPAGVLGVFYITVSSTLAKSSLKSNKLLIQIIINSKIVRNLEPEININPAKMMRAAIDSSLLKAENILKDGNADTPFVFKTIGFDMFNNPTVCDGNSLQLNILGSNNNRISFTIAKAVTTGEAIFTLDNKLSGDYLISSDAGLLPKTAFKNSFGSLSNSKSIINVNTTSVIAGSEASFSVIPKDQYNNNITPNSTLQLISVKVKSPTGNILNTISSISNEQIFFKTILTEQGSNTWIITINNYSKECSDCNTNVSPSVAVPEKSIISYIDESGKINTLSNNLQFTRNNKNPLRVFVDLRDTYDNLINLIPSSVTIKSAILEGNYIDPIVFDVVQSRDLKQLEIFVPSSSENAFRLVVSGNYSFYFSVFSGKLSFKFTFPLKITSDVNDTGYGNGKYVVEQTEVSHTNINMIAGSIFTFNLKLRTSQMLYFNNDINPQNDIKYTISSPDETFKLTAYKVPLKYGNYNIVIYSTLSKIDRTVIRIQLRDPIDSTKFKEIPISINYQVRAKTPPDSEKTQIITKPDSTISAGKNLILQFRLYDSFGNLFVRNSDIVSNNSILVFQNDIQVKNPVISLKTDGVTYEVAFVPTYPPRDFTLKLIYNDNIDQTNIFKLPVSSIIISDPYYPNTLVAGSNLNEMKAGEKLDVLLQFFDRNNVCVEKNDINAIAEVSGPIEASDLAQKINYFYGFKSVVSKTSQDDCKTFYYIEIPDNKIYRQVGTYRIVVRVGDNNFEANIFNQKIIPNVLDPKKFVSKFNMEGNFNPGAVLAGSPISFSIQGNDKFGNQVTTSIRNSLKIKLLSTDSQQVISEQENKQSYDYKISLIENQLGLLEVNLTILKASSYIVQYFYNDVILDSIDISKGPLNISVIPNECSTLYPNVDLSQLEKATAGTPTFFSIRCVDQYQNKISKGGENFIIVITANILSSKTSSDVKLKVVDNSNGTYRIEFRPPLSAFYEIMISLRGLLYGNTNRVEIKDSMCPADLSYICPNDLKKCVKDPIDCLSPENKKCNSETPFLCKVKKIETCVKSRIECDCPDDHLKCDITNACVPANRDYMCPFVIPINCSKIFSKNTIFCPDGICRNDLRNSPSQRVCPYGSVLCGDLTCRSTYSECAVYDDCAGNMIRCADQSCVLDQKDCPSSITCSDSKMFVCPDGSCVFSELFCRPLPRCTNPNPILCANNSCASLMNNCSKQISCGHGKSLCQDVICKSTCLK